MAQENFNVSQPNDGLGDKLRAAFIKVQSNFTDLFTDKVDKEAGKGLSTNDYTTTEKTKLANIEDFAEVNVQADFLQQDDTQDDFIKNKPEIPVLGDYLLNGGYIGTAQDLDDKIDTKANISGQVFTGAISGTNLTGTNTGDQDLSSFALLTNITLQQATLGTNKNLPNGRFQVGTNAGLGQSGIDVNQIGIDSGINNTGFNQNALGSQSGRSNTGLNQNAFGQFAGQTNTGGNQNAFGNSAGVNNTFNDVNLFGQQTQADENGQTVLRSSGGFMTRLSTLLLTETRKYVFPNKSGTFAMIDDLSSVTLQQATAGANKNLVDGIFQAGTGAGNNQTGIGVNQIGNDAGLNNTANNQNAFGSDAGKGNTGENQNAFGAGAGINNSFSNVNLFGENASADENGQTVFRSSSGFMVRLSTLLLTATRKYVYPNKSGTFAMIDDVNTRISGSGTTNQLAKFTASGAVGNSSIFDNGNVGINTTPTLDKFEILGDAFNLGVYRNADFNTAGAASSLISVGQLVGSTKTPAFDFIGLLASISDGEFRVRIRSGNVMTERLRILANGNVGIGTTNPTERLEVVGNGKFSGTVSCGQFTTATEPAYLKGAQFFNTTLNKMRIGGASAYETVTST